MAGGGRLSRIERLVIRFQLAGVAPIVVITGFESERLERQLARIGTVCLYNPDWEVSSDFEDAMIGLRYAERTCPLCRTILLATSQVSAVSPETISALLASEGVLALPVHQGRDGLPLAIRREAILKLARQDGRCLEDFLSLLPDPIDRVTVEDPGVRPSAGESAAVPGDDRLPMRPSMKLGLAREEIFFGPGPSTLLRLIDETGSVRTACVRMKLSYSKGWQLLNLLEEELGVAVIERRPGGQEGGSSKLTAEGRDLLNRYERLVSESQRQVNQLYDIIFRDFLKT